MIKHLLLFNFLFVCHLIFAQSPCEVLTLDDVNLILKEEQVAISITSTELTSNRYASCTYIGLNGESIIRFSIKKNNAFDNFPNLFGQTLDKYIHSGEKLNKIGQNQQIRKYQLIDEFGYKAAVYLGQDEIKYLWIENGEHLYNIAFLNGQINNTQALKITTSIANRMNK